VFLRGERVDGTRKGHGRMVRPALVLG
jgi:hypothetical protein